MIKENHVIGRMGKGYTARIAFDLDVPMGGFDMRCLRRMRRRLPDRCARLTSESSRPSFRAGRDVTVDDLAQSRDTGDPRGISGRLARRSCDANIHAVKRRDYRKGEVICREGDFGATAFFIEKGSVDIFLRTPVEHVENQPQNGLLGSDRPVHHQAGRPPGRQRSRLYSGRCPGRFALRPAASHDECRRHLRRDDLHELIIRARQRSPRARIAPSSRCCATSFTSCSAVRRSAACSRRSIARRTIDGHLRSVPLFAPLRHDEQRFRRIVDDLRPRVSLLRFEPRPGHLPPG